MGTVVDGKNGIVVQGSLYLADSERARTYYRAMLDGSISRRSIGYLPLSIATNPSEPYLETITEGDLIEASLVLRGANPGAVTMDVRSRSLGRPKQRMGPSASTPRGSSASLSAGGRGSRN